MEYPLSLDQLLTHMRSKTAPQSLQAGIAEALKGRDDYPFQERFFMGCPEPFSPGHLTHVTTGKHITDALSRNAHKEYHMPTKKINGSSGEKVERLPEPEMASDGPGPSEYKNPDSSEKVNTGSGLSYSPLPVDVADALHKIGNDLRKQRPVAEGTVMRFTHVGDNGKQYYYAAIFANGSWYTTGHSGRSPFAGFHTHHNFMALLGRYDVIGFEIASSWESVL